MERTLGRPDEGLIVARYAKSGMTWTCRKVNGFYTAEFHVRKTNVTYYSTNKEEINELIREQLSEGFKRVF